MSTYPPFDKLNAPVPLTPLPGAKAAFDADNVPLNPDADVSCAVVPLVSSKFQNPINPASARSASAKTAKNLCIWFLLARMHGASDQDQYTLSPSKSSSEVDRPYVDSTGPSDWEWTPSGKD